jgi:hypothetical protein
MQDIIATRSLQACELQKNMANAKYCYLDANQVTTSQVTIPAQQ